MALGQSQEVQQVLSLLVPPLIGVAFGSIYGLLRMRSQMDRQSDEMTRQARDIAGIEARLVEHEAQLQAQARLLATIAEGVEWIKRAFGDVVDMGRDRDGRH